MLQNDHLLPLDKLLIQTIIANNDLYHLSIMTYTLGTVAKGISHASHIKELNITMNLLKHLYS
jgi:hypothetical protein